MNDFNSVKFDVLYMHVTKGMCHLISPDPKDGAWLIMERIGDDDVLGEYFGTERSDLYTLGNKCKIGEY